MHNKNKIYTPINARVFWPVESPWLATLLLLIGFIFLFWGGPDWYSSRSLEHLWNVGHIGYFFLLASLLFRWGLIAQMSLPGRWTAILGMTLLLGFGVEYLQQGTDRTSDIWDVLRDVTGSLTALAFTSYGSQLRPLCLRYSVRASVSALLLFQLWPVTRSFIDEAIARYQFPMLSNFETPFEIDRWSGNAALSVQAMPLMASGKSLKLLLTTDQYSGAALKYFEGDWTSFKTLHISLYNPAPYALKITCRIHDLAHIDGNEEYEDRFNRNFLLLDGWNYIEIDLNEVKQSPRNRAMDMHRIRGLGLFVTSLPGRRSIYVDDVRLSSSE